MGCFTYKDWRLGLLGMLLGLLLACGQVGQEEVATAVPTSIPNTISPLPSTQLPDNVDWQGHRGARGLKPENSLPAFETALDLGVTTLELDLHYTADGVVVVWHDPAIDKSKCGLDPNSDVEAPDPDSLVKWGEGLMISQLTFEQIQAYRCDRNPDPDRFPEQNSNPTTLAGADYGIISLAELFDFVSTVQSSRCRRATPNSLNANQVQFNIETKRKPDQPKVIDDGFDGENAGAI